MSLLYLSYILTFNSRLILIQKHFEFFFIRKSSIAFLENYVSGNVVKMSLKAEKDVTSENVFFVCLFAWSKNRFDNGITTLILNLKMILRN